MKNISKLAYVYDLDPGRGLGHFTRTNRLVKEFRRKGVKCYLALEDKYRNFHKKIIRDETPIYFEKTNKSFKLLVAKLKTKEIHSILIDSYTLGPKWEKYLSEEGFFIIAIDDHLKKRSANMIFTNKPEIERKFQNSKSQKWFMGPEFALLGQEKKRDVKKKKSINSILLHGGGSSLFNLMKDFTIETIECAEKNSIDLSIVCTTEESQRYVESLLSSKIRSIKIKVLPFKKDLAKVLHNYDVVAGPSGTTTFETILAGSFPFTFQLKDDGRDSLNAFSQIGHLLHLKHFEKNNPKIIADCWQLVLEKKLHLSSILSLKSHQIDGKGAMRTVKHVLSELNQKSKDTFTFKKVKEKSLSNFTSIRSNLSEMRDFLELRNQESVRRVSTSPEHVISWPEHVRWWLNPKIQKFSFKKDKKTVGYYWIKKNLHATGNFLTSGWFLNDTVDDKLRLAKELTACKVSKVKRYYVDFTWIIIMRNNNKIVEKLNTSCGFKIASKLSIRRAKEYFRVDLNDYLVMEMKL